MRHKRRYLALVVDAERALSADEARRVVMDSLLAALGEFGFAESGVKLIALDAAKQLVVVCCSVAALERVLAALALRRSFEGVAVALRAQAMSGTLKALKQKLLMRQKQPTALTASSIN